MPYVNKHSRNKFDTEINMVLQGILKDSVNYGELNYVFSKICWELFDTDPCYNTANSILGVLEAVKQEFYRRKVAGYEEEKIQENGDL